MTSKSKHKPKKLQDYIEEILVSLEESMGPKGVTEECLDSNHASSNATDHTQSRDSDPEQLNAHTYYEFIYAQIIQRGFEAVRSELNLSINHDYFIEKFVCFHCACANRYDALGEAEKAMEQLLEAATLKGVVTHQITEAQLGVGRKHLNSSQLSPQLDSNPTKLLLKKNSIIANDAKRKKEQARVDYAKSEWLKLPKLKNRESSLGADVLIEKFNKKVPAFDTLRRLISKWKKD